MPDIHATAAAYADEETVDTDFVHHLVRGAELLQAGDAQGARAMLERALLLRPKNQRGQNLLALSYFKLGVFDRAEELYQALVAEHPRDPTLRVNLGLVLLKTGRPDEAVGAFAAALELLPEHRKAQNYLGLAYMQKRDFARAREWFERAGNGSMAARMRLAIADAPLSGVGDSALRSLERAQPSTAAPALGTPLAAEPTPAPMDSSRAEPPELPAFSRRVRLKEPAGTPFAVGAQVAVLHVREELFTRLDGLVAAYGPLDVEPAFKRFRGRVTDKPFGAGDRRMMHVAGTGALWVATGGRTFQALEIGDEAAYFREEAVYAFEESLLFENGRVPSKFGGDLHLVHLRNRGQALIASRAPPRALDVGPEDVLRVPLDVLLGWHGNVAPRIVALAGQSADDAHTVVAVELTGEGRVLLDAPA